MKLEPNTESVTTQNVNELEELFLASDIDIRSLVSDWQPHTAMAVEVTAIAALGKHNKTDLLSDIFESEEIKNDNSSGFDTLTVKVMTDLYALWANKEALVAREDNLLNKPEGSFEYRMGKLIADKGTLVSHGASYYGWKDYESYPHYSTERPEALAVFNLKPEMWSEFEDTEATDTTTSGMTCYVFYADGQFRKMRYEATLGGFMEELLD